MPVAPLSIPTEQVHAYAQYGRKNSRGRRQVPHALALKDHTGTNTPLHSRRRSSAQLASFQPSSQPSQPSYSPQTYSFLPLPGEGWTISPTSSLSASPPAPVSLFASPALSPAYSRRPSAARRRPSRADGDVARPSIDSGRLHFPLPPSSPPRPMSAPKSQSRRTSLPAAAFQPPLGPVEPPPTAYQRFFEPVAISRASLAQVAQPPLPVRSTTMDSVNENKMYDDLKTFVFGAASTTHDADMDDAASDAASAYNPLSPPIRPDGVFASIPARRTSTAGLKNARRSSRAGLREAASSSAPGKRRNSRAWIPSDPSVAKPEIAVTSVPRDQDTQDAIDEDDHDALARMMERAKMRAIDDGARRPSLPINIPDSGRRGSRDTDRVRVAPAGSPMDWAKPLPDAPRRPSGTLATAGFDLDFILAAPASYPPANPSGQGITQAAGTAMSWDSYQQGRRESTQFGIPPSFAPPAASSGSHEAQAIDVEDTFLSMVRQLDTEYVRRRNKWSFRQEPRRAYDYDLDPDEEVWGCEPVGTFWVGRDRGVPHGTEGSVPVVIKPLLPQLSPKTQAPPPERRSDIRIHRDEKRPLFKLSLLPAGSQSTVPVKILLATKAMHLKVASAPLRPEGRRRGHTINGEAAFEMVTLSSNSDHSGLGRIDELTYPKTSHAVAFDMLTDAELDHAGRRHVSFGERLRRAFGSESPPPPMVTPPPSFSPPWLMMAPQSAKEEQLKQIRELHTAFRAVGLLTPPKPNSKDAGQANAIKAVRVPHDTHASDKSATEILEDIPADALCMILPFWQFRASAPQAEGFEVYPLASVGRPTNEREYLLVYFVPLGAQNPGPAGTNSRLSKKRSRGNMGHRTTSTNSVSMSSAAAAASWAKGRRTAFHVVARILTASELCASGLRHPGTFVQPDMSSPSHRPRSESGSRAFPTVIAMCNGTGTSVEFVPEGLDRLGLCLPSFEWQSEAERFPGLTPIGIEVVEMVWAGCVAVLGIGC